MKKLKDVVVESLVSISQKILKLIISVGTWFLGIIFGIYNVIKNIVVGIYRLIFKTSMKQKLIFLSVVILVGAVFFISRMNELKYFTLEDNSRVVEEGVFLDLDYRRLKEDKKYHTLHEDNKYLVQMDLTTTNVVIYNKEKNLTYETLSSLVSSEAIKTPFNITYKLKDSTATKTMNAMSASVNEGTYKVYDIENGVRVDYTLGDSKFSLNDMPRFIAPDKFENKILNHISKEDQELILKYFKYSKDRDVYYPTNPRKDASRVYEIIFYESEYTFEDLSEDIYTYTGKDGTALPKASFTFPVEYVFENGKLNVNVLFQNAAFHEEYQIVSMDLLPSFGATLNSKDGYALLPDGSGGIVELNGVKGTNNVYMKPLYNNDQLLSTPTIPYDEKATMPIYGMSNENQGIFAIISKGAEKTNLVLTLSDNETEPNRMFPRIQNVDIYNHDFYGDGSTLIRYFSENKTSEYSIQYNFLDDSNHNYFDLASIYREYLINTYKLDVQDTITSGILVDIIGGIKKEHNVMGIQFDKVEYATSYEEVIQILDQLKEIENLSSLYTGWMNGGYQHDTPTTVKYDSSAGGKKSFEKLVNYINENNLNHYFDVSFIETYKKNNNGFRSTDHGLTNIPNEVLKRYSILPNALIENKTGLTSYYVAPQYMLNVVDRFLNDVDVDLKGLSLRNIGSLYYANYGKKSMEFSEAQLYLEEVLTKVTENEYDVLIKDGYNFTFPYSQYQTDLPIKTSYNGVIDYAVPFKNLVYNGLFDYSGRSVNIGNSTSLQTYILKSIEFGMDIKYTVSQQDSSFFNNTDYSYYYDTKFEDLKEEIFEVSSSISEAKDSIGNGQIVGHVMLQADVFKVTYENGVVLIFNYNNESVEVSGRTIPALDYIVE